MTGQVGILNLINNIYKNSVVNIMLNVDTLDTISQRSGTRLKCLLLSLFFSTVLGVKSISRRKWSPEIDNIVG
jgi:hypothetical protein